MMDTTESVLAKIAADPNISASFRKEIEAERRRQGRNARDPNERADPKSWRAINDPTGGGYRNYWEIVAGRGYLPDELSKEAGFSFSGYATEADARVMAAGAATFAALKRLVAMIEDDAERFQISEAWCNECTHGSTPAEHDKGLCPLHEAKAAIAKAEPKRWA